VAGFTEADAVRLETIEAAPDRDVLLRPSSIALRHLPELCVSSEDAALIRHGGVVLLRGATAPIALAEVWASFNGSALAIGSVRAGHFHPSRVLKG
jgi:tRNA pseudouridine55 synthase